MELLKDMGLEPSMMRNNEGCVVLQPADLQAYAARCVCVFGCGSDRAPLQTTIFVFCFFTIDSCLV